MIVTTHEPRPTQDKFKRVGDAAEQQMAFYLRRAFGESPEIHVFHDLRFEHAGEVAQIDHLIFHRAGCIIVESKSVTSAVRINERGEWARHWDGVWKGMPSPVLQAKRQAELLRAFLQAHREELRSKIMLGLRQGGFKVFMIDVVVAISDQGVVEHDGALRDVRKADQVPERVRELIADHLQLSHPLSRDKRANDWGLKLPAEDFARTSAFLRTRRPSQGAGRGDTSSVPAPHQPPPGRAGGGEPNSITQRADARSFACRACKSTSLEIAFGRSYYFKCRDCGGNTPIQLTCPNCRGQQRTRKSGKQFFAECAACSTSELYFTNA